MEKDFDNWNKVKKETQIAGKITSNELKEIKKKLKSLFP